MTNKSFTMQDLRIAFIVAVAKKIKVPKSSMVKSIIANNVADSLLTEYQENKMFNELEFNWALHGMKIKFELGNIMGAKKPIFTITEISKAIRNHPYAKKEL